MNTKYIILAVCLIASVALFWAAAPPNSMSSGPAWNVTPIADGIPLPQPPPLPKKTVVVADGIPLPQPPPLPKKTVLERMVS